MPRTKLPNVFVSFSGQRSHRVAKALCEFLPRVVNGASPWTSDQIPKGRSWPSELRKTLQDVKLGIMVLTPENARKSWINFEAGALSLGPEKAERIAMPYLVGFKRAEDLNPPLGHLQLTMATEDETKQLVRNLRDALANGQTDETLNAAFSGAFADLKVALDEALATPTATPKRRSSRDMVSEMLSLLRSPFGYEPRDPAVRATHSEAAAQAFMAMKGYDDAVIFVAGDGEKELSVRLNMSIQNVPSDVLSELHKIVRYFGATNTIIVFNDGTDFLDARGLHSTSTILT